MKGRTVLVCPLDWGLGHASRCIPLISRLLELRARVIIAGEGPSLQLLEKEFPLLEKVPLRGFSVRYPSGSNMLLKLLMQLPRIFLGIWREHRRLGRIIKKYNVGLVISDNRFGLYTKKAKCVFMTHQVFIRYPSSGKIIERAVYRINKWFMSRFTECWVPDFEHEISLSGDLSHLAPLPQNTYFVGPLSRFSGIPPAETTQKKFDVALILSGPEPQRSIFEEVVRQQLLDFTGTAKLVRGLPEPDTKLVLPPRVNVVDLADSAMMHTIISSSSLIICRSGYSSIMDLAAIGAPAVLVPTPGQTEQEYLAGYLCEKGYYFTMTQQDFDLGKAIVSSGKFKGLHLYFDHTLLSERLMRLDPN